MQGESNSLPSLVPGTQFLSPEADASFGVLLPETGYTYTLLYSKDSLQGGSLVARIGLVMLWKEHRAQSESHLCFLCPREAPERRRGDVAENRGCSGGQILTSGSSISQLCALERLSLCA